MKNIARVWSHSINESRQKETSKWLFRKKLTHNADLLIHSGFDRIPQRSSVHPHFMHSIATTILAKTVAIFSSIPLTTDTAINAAQALQTPHKSRKTKWTKPNKRRFLAPNSTNPSNSSFQSTWTSLTALSGRYQHNPKASQFNHSSTCIISTIDTLRYPF